MADLYDDYRVQPQTRPNLMQTSGGPQQFYGPSASAWGGMRDGVMAGGLASGMLPALGYGGLLGAGASLARQSFGGLNEIKNGEFFSNLGVKGNWENFASLGTKNKKDAQRDAILARMSAVRAWQNEQNRYLGDVLGQQGADVRNDLTGELGEAIGAGGAMGDMTATQNAMTKFQQRYQQYMLGRQRAGQARQVDAMMADPRRAAERGKRIGAERTQGMGEIAEQYRIGQRDNAFNQARRGTQGGSVDVERQGDLGRGRDRSALGLQQGLDARAQQYRMGDQEQAATLKGLIYSDDPNTAAAFQRTLEGINNQGKMVQENAAINSQRSAQQSAAATGYSQALGGLLSASSQPLGYYLEHRGGGA